LPSRTPLAQHCLMIKGSEFRKADHAIEPILLDRWSPRAMSGEEISADELMRLFEAARWAPSSFSGARFMRAAAPSIGRPSSDYSSREIKPGRKTRPFSSSSFRERHSNTTTSLPSAIPTTPAPRGKISLCKDFSKGSSCTAWKASITNAPRPN
jgi:hypothetical protein